MCLQKLDVLLDVDWRYLIPQVEKLVIVWLHTHSAAHMELYQKIGASTFEEGNIGPSNVVTEFIKRVKTKGAMKGK
jgi:hypothetical protein